jgi:hypothetical protein
MAHHVYSTVLMVTLVSYKITHVCFVILSVPNVLQMISSLVQHVALTMGHNTSSFMDIPLAQTYVQMVNMVTQHLIVVLFVTQTVLHVMELLKIVQVVS